MNLDATPIITSLLDTDAYKLMAAGRFPPLPPGTGCRWFRCRSSEILGAYANEIRQQIQLMANLSLSDNELNFSPPLTFLQEDYLTWLKSFRFNPEQVVVSTTDEGQLAIRISGPWREVIMWEVPLLALVSEIIPAFSS